MKPCISFLNIKNGTFQICAPKIALYNDIFLQKTMRQIYQEKIQKILSSTQTPESLETLEYQLGIDDAGRQAVIGPHVYSAVWIPVKYAHFLDEFFYGDIKNLKQNQRLLLFEALEMLRARILFFTEQIIVPEYISNKMLSEKDKLNLNEILNNAAVTLIKKVLSLGFNFKSICLSPIGDPKKYSTQIQQAINRPDIQINVVPKADLHFKVVSAANIIAKVLRDKALLNWKYAQQITPQGWFGSGGPSDPQLINWMKRNKDQIFGFPNIVRFSWATYMNNAAVQLKFKKREFWKCKEQLYERFGLIENDKSILQ